MSRAAPLTRYKLIERLRSTVMTGPEHPLHLTPEEARRIACSLSLLESELEAWAEEESRRLCGRPI